MNYIILITLNFLALLVFNKSIIPRYSFLILFSWLSYKYVDLADYDGYFQMYDAPNGNSSGQYFLDSTEIGFRFLVSIGNYLDIEFELFKSLIYLFFGYILIKALERIDSKSANLVLALYILYPLILDLVQIRHFIAMSLFIYAFSFFLDSIRGGVVKIRDFLYFLPSLLFHDSFMFLLILVFASYFLINYVFKRQFFIKNILLFFTSYFTTSIIILFFNFDSSSYLNTSTSAFTQLFYITIYSIFYLLLFLIGKRIKYNYDQNVRAYSFLFIYTTLLIGTTLPMLFYHVEFFRFFRVELLLLLSIMFSILYSEKKLLNSFYFIVVFTCYTLLASSIFFIYYFDNLIYPLLF